MDFKVKINKIKSIATLLVVVVIVGSALPDLFR